MNWPRKYQAFAASTAVDTLLGSKHLPLATCRGAYLSYLMPQAIKHNPDATNVAAKHPGLLRNTCSATVITSFIEIGMMTCKYVGDKALNGCTGTRFLSRQSFDESNGLQGITCMARSSKRTRASRNV